MPMAPRIMKPMPIQSMTEMKRTQGFVPASWAMVPGETASAPPPLAAP